MITLVHLDMIDTLGAMEEHMMALATFHTIILVSTLEIFDLALVLLV